MVVSTPGYVSPHPSPLCSWEMNLQIGGVAVHLAGRSLQSWEALLARFGPFAAEAGLTSLHLQVEEEASPWHGVTHDSFVTASDAGWQLLLNLEARHALVAGPAVAEGVEAALRLALPYVLPDGLLLHAVLLRDGERGFLGVGPSGCGKSTLARLLPAHALGDELAVVNGSESGWTAGSFPTSGARGGAVTVAAIYFLRPAPRHQRRPVPPSRAAALLAQQCHWPTDRPELGRRRFDTLTRLAASVPCWALGFAREKSVFQLIVGGG